MRSSRFARVASKRFVAVSNRTVRGRRKAWGGGRFKAPLPGVLLQIFIVRRLFVCGFFLGNLDVGKLPQPSRPFLQLELSFLSWALLAETKKRPRRGRPIYLRCHSSSSVDL